MERIQTMTPWTLTPTHPGLLPQPPPPIKIMNSKHLKTRNINPPL